MNVNHTFDVHVNTRQLYATRNAIVISDNLYILPVRHLKLLLKQGHPVS